MPPETTKWRRLLIDVMGLFHRDRDICADHLYTGRTARREAVDLILPHLPSLKASLALARRTKGRSVLAMGAVGLHLERLLLSRRDWRIICASSAVLSDHLELTAVYNRDTLRNDIIDKMPGRGPHVDEDMVDRAILQFTDDILGQLLKLTDGIPAQIYLEVNNY